jgi:predicted DsbA family dithiol-disulfide isomerase
MFVFMGSYSGDYDSSDDDDSQDEESTDDHTQTGVDDYTGDGGGDGSGEDSSGGKAAAAGAAGAAGTAGAGGGGAAGTAASGAGGGAVTEPPEGEDSGDGGEPEDEECEDEEEKQPESPDVEEPDVEPEHDVDEPETEEDAEEDADEEEDEDEDEEEDETVVVVQEVDALSAMSWGVQPVMKHVEECYGEEIEVFYKPAPVREIDPKKEKEKWTEAGQQVDMPIDPSFWDEGPPESTELVNKAFEAAIQQYRGMEYIRALWRRGVAAGRDINDKEVLIELASELGLDSEQFEEDLDEVELEAGKRGELPFTFMEIQSNPVSKNGRVRYSDFTTQFTFQGIEEREPQELQGFVDEHGPVAAPEIMEVYGIQREEAIQRLEDLNESSSFEIGGEDFWY